MISIIFCVMQCVMSTTHPTEVPGSSIGFALVQLKAKATSSHRQASLDSNVAGSHGAEVEAVQVLANFTRSASSLNVSKGELMRGDAHANTTRFAGPRNRPGARESVGHTEIRISINGHAEYIGGSTASDNAQVVAATKPPIARLLPFGLLQGSLRAKNSNLPWHMDIFARSKHAEAPAHALLHADSSKWTLLFIFVIIMMLLDYLIFEPMSRRREPLPVNVETALEDIHKSSVVTSKSFSRRVLLQLCRRSCTTAELFGVHFPDAEEVLSRRFEPLGESMDTNVGLEELKSFYLDEIQPMSSSTFARHVLALIFWVGVAGAFNVIVWERMGGDAAWQFSSGYVLEWLLSMDNLFVFHLIFKMYRTPRELVHKALFAGIVGALLFRMFAFVALTEALSMLSWARFAFAVFLIYSGVMTAIGDDDDEGDVANNFLVVLLERALGDRILKRYDKRGILVSIGGKLHATLLLPVIVCIEVSDILFAVDSVSAKVAQIPDYYISYSSSIFALFGLRAMFFIIQEMVDMFAMLKYGLSFILVFIGAELLFSDYFEVPAQTVCAVICGVFAISIGASLVYSGGHSDKEEC